MIHVLPLALTLALAACETPTSASSLLGRPVSRAAVSVPTRAPEPVECREVTP